MQVSNPLAQPVLRAPRFSGLPELWNNQGKEPAKQNSALDISDLVDLNGKGGSTPPPQTPAESTSSQSPRGPRKWLRNIGVAMAGVLGIGLVSGGIAYGPLGGKDNYAMERAYHDSAVADQEYNNSQLKINGNTYNGGIDPDTGLGYVILDTAEFVELTKDGEGKEFRNSEWVGACAVQELGRWIAGHEHANRETVDFIFTDGETVSGEPLKVLIKVDNRELARNHSNLNVKTGAELPDDCTDIPGNIVEGAGDLLDKGGELLDDITPDIGWP